jgi:Probable cobalt transporter subunit (CbtB).
MRMSYTRQLLLERSDIPKVTIAVLVAIMLFGLFSVGFDQGQLFSLVEGKEAFDSNWLHEFVHDMRHAAGFPCH